MRKHKNHKLLAASHRHLRLEYLERRDLLSSIDFLRESADLYSVSRNPMDAGAPVIPIYSDFHAGGDYLSSVWAEDVQLDGNDPDTDPVSGGSSSWRMTVSQLGRTGWFQFNTGTNGPRNIPEFGAVSTVRFMAKGDKPGQQLKIKVVGRLPGNRSELFWVGSLTTNWADYSVSLPGGVRPADIDAVQFVLGDGWNQGGGTVRLDQVRLGVAGIDRLRLAQSYRPIGHVDDNPAPPAGSVQQRDLEVYPSRAFLYDQAMAIKAFVAAGDVQAARDVADAIIATRKADGSYFNERPAGHVLNRDGTPKGPLSQLQTLGDNAWVGLGLIDVYRVTGDVSYLTYARRISNWAEDNLKDSGPLGGYRGGFDSAGNAVGWRSVEHAIDLGQLNRLLAAELEKRGDVSAPIFLDRARFAWDFVIAMYDASDGKFWAGTTTGDTINTASVPLDAQTWSALSLGQSADYATAINWSDPLAWAETHLRQTDGPYSGFTFSSGSPTGIVWFEGTAHSSVLFATLGQEGKYAETLETLNKARNAHPNGDGNGIVAASGDSLTDPSFGTVTFDARLSVSASAWDWFAQRRINPFDPVDIVPPVADLLYPTAGAATNQDTGYIDVHWSDPGWPSTGVDDGTIDVNDLAIVSGGNALPIASVEALNDGIFRYHYVGALNNGRTRMTFTAGQVADLVGNVNTRQTAEFFFDSIPPSVSVNRLLTKDGQPPLSGALDDPAASIEITVAGTSYVATNNGNGTWSLPDNVIQPPLADGRYEIEAVAVDAVGNVGRDYSSWELTIGDPPYQNPVNPLDVSADSNVFPLDALLVINYLNAHPGDSTPPEPPVLPPPFLDVSGDDLITPVDALLVINQLNQRGSREGEQSIEAWDFDLARGTSPRANYAAALASRSTRALRRDATSSVQHTAGGLPPGGAPNDRLSEFADDLAVIRVTKRTESDDAEWLDALLPSCLSDPQSL